jgi:hypothetical protein
MGCTTEQFESHHPHRFARQNAAVANGKTGRKNVLLADSAVDKQKKMRDHSGVQTPVFLFS